MIAAKRKIRTLLYSRLIYTFIKVKSNKGKKGDGCAKTYWLQPFFSFGCNSVKQVVATKIQFSLVG